VLQLPSGIAGKKATRAEVLRQITQAQHEWRDADPARETSGWHPVSWLRSVTSYYPA